MRVCVCVWGGGVIQKPPPYLTHQFQNLRSTILSPPYHQLMTLTIKPLFTGDVIQISARSHIITGHFSISLAAFRGGWFANLIFTDGKSTL